MKYDNAFLGGHEAMDLSFASRPATSVAMLTAFQEHRVLSLVLNEILTLAVLISATTSVVNRLEGNIADPVSHDALLAHLPIELNPSTVLSGQLVYSELPTDLLADLQDFHARLATTRSMTLSFCRYPAELRLKGGVHIEVLSGGWRDLCQHTGALIHALRSANPGENGAGRTPKVSRTLALLSACANGEAPCVMTDGSVEVPGLAERRRHPRWMVDWPVLLLLGTTEVPAQIVDISFGGFCLTTVEPLRLSETVTVELPSGRHLSGRIAWCRGQSFGLKFDTPLVATDPVVVAAQTAGEC